MLALLATASVRGRSQLWATGMRGFSQDSARVEQALEELFLSIPSPEKAREQHRFFTAEPHPAGSERNNALARYIADKWKEQGWEDVRIHRYDVLVSNPREVAVEMVNPYRFRAALREDAYEVDPDTRHAATRPGYLALSASGEVTAPLIYANSGNPEDYELLRRNGIDVRGKIVIVRYSNPYSYRGFKALTAQRMGAAAIIVYSDPSEDGYKRGKVFPHGPWGPESHIQRGAITYDFLVAGDPLTPGWASVPDARRIAMEEAVSIPRIIAVPLSWRDAKPLLGSMDGPPAPKAWKGGLPIAYRLGGQRVRVRIKVDMDTRVMPNYVVEARIRGAEFPEEWILLGNHRDAWEFGGVDPSSGTASLMELTRAVGELRKRGWSPRRTLIVCSWDGEEVALTGSTEWGEEFGEDLKAKLVAYINVDSSASGPRFEPTAVASLAPLVVEISRSVRHPSGKSLYEDWRDRVAAEAGGAGRGKPVTDDRLVDVRIGSGSDHTVFLNHLGRPTIGLTFGGPYGVYHSIYDDFFWMNHFGDPGYRYHTLLAQVWGLLALRLANADILPFDFASYGRSLREFVSGVRNSGGAAKNLDFRTLESKVERFRAVGEELKRAVERSLMRNTDNLALAAANRKIISLEGNWLTPGGIPGRPWFKHLLYAARPTYAHLELPGLTEAVERSDWTSAREQMQLIEEALDKNIVLLKETIADLANGRM